MYLDYYGFTAHPFLMTPDARLFFASSVHARAHAHLVYGLAQREGFPPAPYLEPVVEVLSNPLRRT